MGRDARGSRAKASRSNVLAAIERSLFWSSVIEEAVEGSPKRKIPRAVDRFVVSHSPTKERGPRASGLVGIPCPLTKPDGLSVWQNSSEGIFALVTKPNETRLIFAKSNLGQAGNFARMFWFAVRGIKPRACRSWSPDESGFLRILHRARRQYDQWWRRALLYAGRPLAPEDQNVRRSYEQPRPPVRF